MPSWFYLLMLIVGGTVVVASEASGQELTAESQEVDLSSTGSSEQGEEAEAEEQWVDLLAESPAVSWRRVGGRAEFEEVDRVFVATIRAGHQTTFLCGNQEWGDFELSCQFRVDPGLNAGIQVRTKPVGTAAEEKVEGLQVEIDSSERGWTGSLYDQGRRNWLATLETRPDVRGAFKPDQWNSLKVIAQGDSVTTWVNDVLAVSIANSPYRSGIIGIQVHSTQIAAPKSLRIRELKVRTMTADDGIPQGD